MAYGKQNSGFNGRSISAKYTSKDGTEFLEVPIFKLSEKQGDKYPELTPEQLKALTGAETHPTEISGNLIDITVREGEYEGSPVRSFKLVLQDGDTRNYVDFGLGSMNGRTAANLVLNLKAFEDVQISSWSSFDKAKNKSFSKISVRQGSSTETIKWKYDGKTEGCPLPAPREFAGKGGKTERDFTEQEIFFYQELEKFAEVVKAAAKNAPKNEQKQAVNETSTTEAPAPTEDHSEDPPF